MVLALVLRIGYGMRLSYKRCLFLRRNNSMQENTTIPQMVEQLRAGKLPRRQLVKALTAIGVSTVGVNAIVASAENPSAAKPSPTVDVTEDSTTHLQIHDQHLANQTQGN